jgi:hypothetical protein
MLQNTVTASREGETALTPACKGSLFHLEINGREPPRLGRPMGVHTLSTCGEEIMV